MKKRIYLIALYIIFINTINSNTFQNANLEFTNNNFNEAERLYLLDLKENGNDINTLFNLSNVLIKQNKLGKALYYLYLSRIYSPLDLNIKNEINDLEEILEVKSQYKYYIPISNLALIRVNLLTIFIILILLMILKKTKLNKRIIKVILFIISFIFLITSLGLIFNKLDSNIGILLDNSEVKISPYASSQNSFTINPGLKVKIKDNFNDYYFIEDEKNRYGWVIKDDIGLIWKE